MDGRRFDDLTKSLACGATRRQVLKALVGGLVGGLGGIVVVHSGPVEAACVTYGRRCTADDECCSGICEFNARGRGACDNCPNRECPEKTYLDQRDCQCRCKYDKQVCGPAEVCTSPTGCMAGCPDGQTYCDGNCLDPGQCCTIDDCQPEPATCLVAASCDASNSCQYVQAGDNTSCGVGRICCGGACIAACTASDDCHEVGVCDPVARACTNPVRPNDVACGTDGICCNGSCIAACTPLDQCHDAGKCDPGTGACTNPNKTNGAPCNDDNPCTSGDTCQNGICQGGSAVVCTTDNPCLTASCNPSSGCTTSPKSAGAPCDDATLCNGSEACDGAGNCLAGTPVTCDPCLRCNATSGMCEPDAGQNGASCPGDGNKCFGGFVCDDGSCVGADPVTCTAQDVCHKAGVCDPMTGQCSNPDADNGTDCSVGLPPHETGTCQSGVCQTTCDPGYADCDSTISGCETNLMTDASNCGQCGHACASGEICQDQTCVCGDTGGSCPSGKSCCSGQCVDRQTDPSNCGTCGHGCSSPANATATCVGGQCVVTCDQDYKLCNGDCISETDTCVAGICGAGDNFCVRTGYQTCGAPGSEGACLCGVTTTGDSICFRNAFACGSICTVDADCGAGRYCAAAGDSCCGTQFCVEPCPDPATTRPTTTTTTTTTPPPTPPGACLDAGHVCSADTDCMCEKCSSGRCCIPSGKPCTGLSYCCAQAGCFNPGGGAICN